MLDTKQTEVRKVNLMDLFEEILLQDKVLLYIDEQVCSRLTGTAKKNCKQMIDTNGRDLINKIQSGTVSEVISFFFLIVFEYLANNAYLYTSSTLS